jgi:hypothetical protein
MADDTKTSNAGTNQVSSRLSDEELEQLQRLSELTGKTQSRLIREAVVFFMGVRFAGFSIESDPVINLVNSNGISDLANRFENILSLLSPRHAAADGES